MNKLIRRIATTTASLAAVGVALVGTAGAASATSLPAKPVGRVAVAAPADRDGGHHHHDGRGHWGNGHDGKDGYWYWDSHDRRHHYRYDGHRWFRWIDGKWVIVLTGHHSYQVDAWHWYVNQVLDSQKQNDHKA
jgi:hypothetical protein